MYIEILKYILALSIALGVLSMPIILDVIVLDIADSIFNNKHKEE